MDNAYFQELIGMPIGDFTAQFVGVDDPIDDAICWMLYKVQESGAPTPKGFVDQARRYLLGSKA